MNSEARELLKRHIEVKMERDPDSRPSDVEKWILASGDLKFNFKEVNPTTLRNFVTFNVKKMKDLGSLDRKAGSGGYNALSKTDVVRIKRLTL